MNIRKGDTVAILTGTDRGKRGKVLRSFPDRNLVVVEGVNIRKRHRRPRRSTEKGQIIERAMPIHVSNVAIPDPVSGKPSRIGHKRIGNRFVRIAKKSGTEI